MMEWLLRHGLQLIPCIVVACVMHWQMRVSELTPARRIGNRSILAYPTGMRVFGIILALPVFLFSGFLAFGSVSGYWPLRAIILFRILTPLLFSALALYLVLEPLLSRVEFDSEYIYTFSPWRGTRTIPWNRVSSCRYSNINQWHVLETDCYGKIRLSGFLCGLADFWSEMRRQGMVITQGSRMPDGRGE